MSTRNLKAFREDGSGPPALMIKILRYANNWTHGELAKAMNEIKIESPKKEPKIRAADISRYESGEVYPGEIALKKLCKAFKVSPSFIFISRDTHPETIEYLVKLIKS